jgi:hypothetical protein
MEFTTHDGFHYRTDECGALVQVCPQDYKYDAAYSAIYDTEAYRRGNETLQALRLGFVQAAHGERVHSLLDMGYGNGAFMEFAKHGVPWVGGYDITGVPVPAGTYKINSIHSLATNIDVITFWDCLEHLHDLEFLLTLPCKTIAISLPYCHFRKEGREWFETNYIHRKPNEHVRHFDATALSCTMAKFGWREVALSGHEDIVRKSKHGLQNILTMAFKR